MIVKSMYLKHLKTDPNNARKHGAKNMEAIQESLRRFGQLKPVVVTKSDLVVRAGNGTVAAARALGWKEIAVVLVDLSEEEAKKYAVADNRTSDLSEWDSEELTSLLSHWDNADRAAVGWADADIEALLKESSQQAEATVMATAQVVAGQPLPDVRMQYAQPGEITVLATPQESLRLNSGYSPSMAPQINAAQVTPEQMQKAAQNNQMAQLASAGMQVCCPSCAHVFVVT